MMMHDAHEMMDTKMQHTIQQSILMPLHRVRHVKDNTSSSSSSNFKAKSCCSLFLALMMPNLNLPLSAFGES